ncbi:MAG: hypothetical protein ABL936_00760 [Aestuariivirga sp.]
MDRKNLCDSACFAGCTLDGGCAGLYVADAKYRFSLDENAAPESRAALLCAGLIGHRVFRLAGDARKIDT